MQSNNVSFTFTSGDDQRLNRNKTNFHVYRCTTYDHFFLKEHLKIIQISLVRAYTVGLYSNIKIHSKSEKFEKILILFRFQSRLKMTQKMLMKRKGIIRVNMLQIRKK